MIQCGKIIFYNPVQRPVNTVAGTFLNVSIGTLDKLPTGENSGGNTNGIRAALFHLSNIEVAAISKVEKLFHYIYSCKKYSGRRHNKGGKKPPAGINVIIYQNP